MADQDVSLVPGELVQSSSATRPISTGDLIGLDDPEPAPPSKLYRMRARDLNCPALTYRVWTADFPDATGAEYSGPICGVSRNFGDVTIELIR